MEHLALEIFSLDGNGSQWAWLPDDASISITDTSEVFAKGDVWSHSFTLNVSANAHIFGTAGDLHGSRLHDQIDRRKARLWVEQIPLYLGYLRLGDEAEVDGDGDVDVTFESGKKTFDDLVEGAKANQVPMIGDVRFGVALWRKRYVNIGLKIAVSAVLANGNTTSPQLLRHELTATPGDRSQDIIPIVADGAEEGNAVQEYPRMVFPKGEFIQMNMDANGHRRDESVEIDCLNVDHPYTEDSEGKPTYPYCNVALCYQKYGYDKKMKDGSLEPDYSAEPEAQRGYEEMPADRVNSAPNFFVLYWLKALMKHLGIHVDENQMMDVEDLRRLFFVNTKCAYRDTQKDYNIRTTGWAGNYYFKDGSDERPRRLVPEQFAPHEGDRWNNPKKLIKIEDCAFQVKSYDTPSWSSTPITGFIATVWEVAGIEDDKDYARAYGTVTQKEDYEDKNKYLHDAIATSECFPDVDISEVIKALEDGFGVRFLFSDDYQRVRIVLLRNLFRNDSVQKIDCEVIGDVKVENSIRGFRMTYGDSEDTHFYYKGFNDKLPHQKTLWPDTSDTHDYSHWNLDAEYGALLNNISAFDKTCYVTPVNGDAWGIKVDKNAKRYDELHPSLFEYAGFMDAEDGDCTGDPETIEEITLGFKPAIMNDCNWEEERASGTEEQRFALFVDEQMRPRRPDLAEENVDFNDPEAYYDVDGRLYGTDGDGRLVYGKMMADDGIVKPGEFAITSDVYAKISGLYADIVVPMPSPTHDITGKVTGITIEGHANEGYRLYMQDNYEPNDDGVCPIETHDWGLTLGIMRGSGSGAGVTYEGDPDDKEGNDTWYEVSGSSITSHPDTCDNYGNEWSYKNTTKIEKGGAAGWLSTLFPSSHASFYVSGATGGYINGAGIATVKDDEDRIRHILVATHRGSYAIDEGAGIDTWVGKSTEEILALDAASKNIIVEMDSNYERVDLLLKLCRLAYDPNYSEPVYIDNDDDGTHSGRFSLKLRAEKPNPKFNPKKAESSTNKRYLDIDRENLRRRGLADQFYTEYSYWVRNARIARRTVRMELAQLLAIDKTVQVTVGDVTGFIRKMQYSVSNKTGLGEVTMEIMYI